MNTTPYLRLFSFISSFDICGCLQTAYELLLCLKSFFCFSDDKSQNMKCHKALVSFVVHHSFKVQIKATHGFRSLECLHHKILLLLSSFFIISSVNLHSTSAGMRPKSAQTIDSTRIHCSRRHTHRQMTKIEGLFFVHGLVHSHLGFCV